MYKVSRRDLESWILVAMRAAPNLLKRKISVALDEREFAAHLVKMLDNDSTMVIRADPVGFNVSQRPGVFGVDEPSPVPLD